jgi:hypothetical protein
MSAMLGRRELLAAGLGAIVVSASAINAVSGRAILAPTGLVGDGVANDGIAIQAAINEASAAGGGIVQLPVGTFALAHAGGAIALSLLSNVELRGRGRATVLKLLDGANCHIINMVSGSTNMVVRDMTLDGNRANQTAGHGIRGAGVTGLLIENVLIRQSQHYGIGLQRNGAKNVKISNVTIEDTGADGIDFKNALSTNEHIHLNNVSVRRWGLNPAQTVQAAIDCRGPVQCTNIWISEPGAADSVGWRCREGEVIQTHGDGGHRSVLSNFFIRMTGGTSRLAAYSQGRDVTIANGHITGGWRGVQVQDGGNRIGQVVVEGVTDDGFKLLDSGGGQDAGEAILTGCRAVACGDGFENSADNIQLVGCTATECTSYGFRNNVSASGVKVVGGVFTGNTGGNIIDVGTSTVFIGVTDGATIRNTLG